MADVKEIVKKMLDQGMSEEQIKSSLQELGFSKADEILAKVKGAAGKPGKQEAAQKPEEKEQGSEGEGARAEGLMITSVGAEGEEKQVGVGESREGGGLFEQQAVDAGKLEEKLDETIALLKALQALNKKILESQQKLLNKLG